MMERQDYLTLIKFRLEIFAMAFSRDVMVSYQFGTDWSTFSDKERPAIGPLKANDATTAMWNG